jgi:predicted Zn-dependent protease
MNFYIKSIICILLLLISCAVNPVTGKKELMLVSERQELELGRNAAPSMNWEFGGKYRDPALEFYLNDIVNNIWRISERPHIPFKFYIQNTSIPNAFALPGYVAITRGLLSDIDNEAQFAAIMGHEAGHVMARHTAQRLSRVTLQQMGLAIGSSLLQGTEGADTLLTVGAVGTSLLLLKYDRDQEIQADRLGVKYIARLGYNPVGAMQAHEILEKSVDDYLKRLGKSRGDDNFINNLLSTHPRKKVRLSEIQNMIDELPSYTIRDDGMFNTRFQSRIEQMKEVNRVYHIYDEAEDLYKKKKYSAAEQRLIKAISLNNRQAPFYNLSGFIKIQNNNYPDAAKSFNKALSIDPEYQPSIYGLGLIKHFEGKHDEAIPRFKKSLKLYPNHIGTHLALGKSYYFIRQYRQAISHLDNFSKVAPKHPEIHGLLGICYEATGSKNLAIMEYRYQLEIAPDTKLGHHAKKRLTVLAPAQTE